MIRGRTDLSEDRDRLLQVNHRVLRSTGGVQQVSEVIVQGGFAMAIPLPDAQTLQLCHLLAGQAARAQPGAPELARDGVTSSIQAAAERGRHRLGILGLLYVGASAHETS